MDVAQLAFAVKDLLRPLPRKAERFGEGTQQFDDLCNVIVVFTVFRARLRIEEVVTRDELKDLDNCERRTSGRSATQSRPAEFRRTYHTRHTPYIRTCTPFGPQNNFGRAILSCLDVVGKVVTDPTGIPQISDFDRDNIAFRFVFRFFGGFIQGYAGYFTFEEVTSECQLQLRSATGHHAYAVFSRCFCFSSSSLMPSISFMDDFSDVAVSATGQWAVAKRPSSARYVPESSLII